MSSTRITLLLCLTSPLLAQEQPPAPAAPEQARPDPAALLEKAIQRMARTTSLRYRTTETQNSSMQRLIARQAGGMMVVGGGDGDKSVQGSWQDGLLKASLNQDRDEVLLYRGRQLARNDDVDWRLRRNNLVNGSPQPFILDPGLFFEALQAIPKAQRVVRQAAEINYKDLPTQLISLSLSGEAAREFALSGALPEVTSGVSRVSFAVGMGGGMAPPPPELRVDLALYIHPTTGDILKVRARCDQESNLPGNFQIRVGGAGGLPGGGEEEEEEEEVKERDDQGRRIYRRGLPVRKLDKATSRMDFTATFTQHGHPLKIQLSDRARRLLRIGQ